MCGIPAIFSYRDGRPVSESELLAIRDRMTSRGPDGAGPKKLDAKGLREVADQHSLAIPRDRSEEAFWKRIGSQDFLFRGWLY